MRLIALIGFLILILGLGTVNIEHHLNLPVFDKHLIVVHRTSLGNKVIDIRMNEEIKGVNTVKEIVQVVAEAGSWDVINFHLAGYGGDEEATLLLINTIKKSKATVNMLVEAPVYSAHAYLATQSNTLTMAPLSFLMFHTASNYGYDCKTQTGTDRTVSNVEHCQKALDANNIVTNKMIDSVSILTPEEKEYIKTGHDVYIQSDDIKSRQT